MFSYIWTGRGAVGTEKRARLATCLCRGQRGWVTGAWCAGKELTCGHGLSVEASTTVHYRVASEGRRDAARARVRPTSRTRRPPLTHAAWARCAFETEIGLSWLGRVHYELHRNNKEAQGVLKGMPPCCSATGALHHDGLRIARPNTPLAR